MAKVTKDYKQFKFLINNRNTDRGHINRLKEAISKNQKILAVQPILVNERFEIIDGQHRFTAAKELGLDIHYTVVNNLDIDTAREMNVLQKRWNLSDYANSYAKAGNENYKAYLKYRTEHPSLSATVVYYVMAGASTNKLSAEFKSGKFVAAREQDEIEYILERLEHIREATGNEIPISRSLANAICISLDKNEDFDLDVIVANLRKNPELFHRISVNKEAFRMLEDIHNRNKSTHFIRLY